MPALDEEAALPAILAAMPSGLHSVVVADNGSTDATAGVARAGGAHVVFEEERGYGAACLAGIRHLAQQNDRPDVLVFQTDILGEDIEVTGPIVARLWISSDCPDTDFTAKLIDV